MDMAGAIREALEVVWKNEKTEKKYREKTSSEVGACFGSRFGPQNGIALEPK